MWQQLANKVKEGDKRSLARAISLVENDLPGYEELLQKLPHHDNSKIIGVTGPPGAGKSTLVDALIGLLNKANKKTAVLCVDPSSPFHYGALLGDRIRMNNWYNNPMVFIRSLATRGNLGGLHPKIIEIADLLNSSFDYIIIETVGVGQNEVEIASLADITVVVLVPESGDEIQTMKAGLMEIADIFVVNKCDRPGADLFVKNLHQLLSPKKGMGEQHVPVFKTIASTKQGLEELYDAILLQLGKTDISEKRLWVLTERAYQLIQKRKMKGIDREMLSKLISGKMQEKDFSLYQIVDAMDKQ